jgi:hypothetical protein
MALALVVALAVPALSFACGRREVAPPLPAPELAAPAPAPPAAAPPWKPTIERFTGATPQLATRWQHLSGTSGTVIIPANTYVTSIWAHNTTSGGTLTIAPSGPNLQTACAAWDAGPDPYDAHLADGAAFDAGPDLYDGTAPTTCQDGGTAITIPAASAWSVTIPTLTGSPNEIGPGSVLVFTSTDSYVLTLNYYGP